MAETVATGFLRIENVEHVGRYHRAVALIAEACQRYEFDATLQQARDDLIEAAKSLTFHLRERGKKK